MKTRTSPVLHRQIKSLCGITQECQAEGEAADSQHHNHLFYPILVTKERSCCIMHDQLCARMRQIRRTVGMDVAERDMNGKYLVAQSMQSHSRLGSGVIETSVDARTKPLSRFMRQSSLLSLLKPQIREHHRDLQVWGRSDWRCLPFS